MFLKRQIVTSACLLYVGVCLSNNIITCPSVEDIKQGHVIYWLPLYKEGEELASDKDVTEFRKQVTVFESGRWDSHYLESAHCFYQGTGDFVNKIVFAQDAWHPNSTPHWTWTLPAPPWTHAECHSSVVNDCEFLQ